ncbi:MAG TPA: TlpA disulfide reductase family protein [Bryobacteraceae bacterium]|nr:TlpA disulfide reductase family protein [Bryobacteraceae bacterium]
MRQLKLLALFLIAGTLVLLISHSRRTPDITRADTKVEGDRKPAPDFTLKDASGATIALSSYRGKVVLLNFWATWCGPCELEIPWFEQFEQQYKSKGFEVVGVSMDDDGWPTVKPFIAAKKINYRILLGNDSVTQLYGGVDALPTTFMIDRDGRIADVHVGLAGKDEYANEIQNLLAGRETTDSSRGARPVAGLLTGATK